MAQAQNPPPSSAPAPAPQQNQNQAPAASPAPAPTTLSGQPTNTTAYKVDYDQNGNAVYDVNQQAAQNPYLNQELGAIGAQTATVQNQKAFTAGGPQAFITAQSAAPNVNQQGFNAQGQALTYAQQQALGQGPAAQAVQMQSQSAIGSGINAAMALAGSQRGGNAGEALRQGELGQAQVTGQAASQAAQNTLSSEQAGQQNLGNISGQMQGESLNQAQLEQQNSQFNAGAINTSQGQYQALQQQTNLANAQAQNQWQTTQDQMVQSLMNSGMSLEQAQTQANTQMAEYATGSAADQYAASQGHAISQQNADTSSASAAIGGLQTAANVAQGIGSAVSDRRAKKNIEAGTPDAAEFLDALTAKTYDYKDPEKHGEGRHLGVMAQDLQKSDLGDHMVASDDEGTLRVDYGKGMAAIVASLAYLNEKMKKLEAGHGG